MKLALACAVALALVACQKKPAPSAAPIEVSSSAGYSVFKGGKLVLWIDDKPGALTSQALPPGDSHGLSPDVKPPQVN